MSRSALLAWLPVLLLAGVADDAPLRYERRTLPSGATLLVSEQRNVPMLVVGILVDAGSRRDPVGKEGLAGLTADLLTEGTRTRSATDISDAIDFIGGSLDAGAGVDSAQLGLTILSKDLDTGLELLADVLLNPTFPQAEVNRRRDATLASMKASEDQPGYVAQRAFTEHLFAGQPYGHLTSGTPEGLRRIGRADVLGFYRANYTPAHSIIAIAGDIDADTAAAAFDKALASWRSAADSPFEYPSAAPAAPKVIKIQKPVSQANIVLGHRGVARDNPDYYAIEIMNFILGGGGFGSRLLDRIRTKEGLAYSVGSDFATPKSPGSFRIVLQTKNDSAADAVRLACEEIDRMRREPVTDEEIADAKLYLTGSFPLQLDSNGEIAAFLTEVEFFNLGADFADSYAMKIAAVTKEDVLRVARRYLQPEQLSLVVVADLEQATLADAAPCPAK